MGREIQVLHHLSLQTVKEFLENSEDGMEEKTEKQELTLPACPYSAMKIVRNTPFHVQYWDS